jgi:hypothetical protein
LGKGVGRNCQISLPRNRLKTAQRYVAGVRFDGGNHIVGQEGLDFHTWCSRVAPIGIFVIALLTSNNVKAAFSALQASSYVEALLKASGRDLLNRPNDSAISIWTRLALGQPNQEDFVDALTKTDNQNLKVLQKLALDLSAFNWGSCDVTSSEVSKVASGRDGTIAVLE